MGDLRFDDRVAVVTGAGRGMGRCHALLLAAKGAKVVVADVGAEIDGTGGSAGPANDVVAEIEALGGEAVACVASVAVDAEARSMVDTALATWGRLDVVVNNAGFSDMDAFGDLPLEKFRRIIDVHYYGMLQVTKAAWPHFLNAGYGRVVFTTSEAIIGGIPDLTSYGAGKGAVFGLMRNLATEAEGLPQDIRVNAIAPRANTRMTMSDLARLKEKIPTLDPEVLDKAVSTMRPELVSPVVAYLSHEECTVNGETLIVGSGGVYRLALVQSTGVVHQDLTAEDVAADIDRILDLTGATLRDTSPFEPH